MKKSYFILTVSAALCILLCGCDMGTDDYYKDKLQTSEATTQSSAADNTSSKEEKPYTEKLDFDEKSKLMVVGAFGDQFDNVKLAYYENGHLYAYGSGATQKLTTASAEYEVFSSESEFSSAPKTSSTAAATYTTRTATSNNGEPQIKYFSFEDKDISELYIKEGVTTISDGAFSMLSDLTAVNFSSGIEGMGAYAFFHCDSLTKLDLPDSLKTIDKEAFTCCSGLTEVNFGSSTDSISEAAFMACYSLPQVDIPKSVKNIGKNAFAACFDLNRIIFHGDMPEFGERVFARDKATLYYPVNAKGWEELQDPQVLSYKLGGDITLVAYDPDKGLDAVESEPESDKPLDWKALYREFLSDYVTEQGYHFELLYIDEDDIPELVMTQTLIGNGRGRLYTIYNGEVKELGAVSAYGTFYYKEKGNLMAGYSLRQGYNSTGITKIENGERVYVHTFNDNALTTETPIYYKIDDKEVTKDEYDKTLNEIMNSMSVCDFDSIPAVNEANVASKLS